MATKTKAKAKVAAKTAAKGAARGATPAATRAARRYGFRTAKELAAAVGFSRVSVAAALTGRAKPGIHLKRALDAARAKYRAKRAAALRKELAALEGSAE